VDVNPPLFALIRGPFAGTGYQVATLSRPEDPSRPAVVLCFTSRERAESHAARRPGGFADWRVGPLPTLERMVFFLERLPPSIEHISIDPARDAESEDVALPLETVLPAMRERAIGGGRRGGGPASPA
jgi:hypothetical protein